ncbi:MAG: glutaminyl-peptide cyclotransferase [Acidobacteriota bacterium]|nr:glutaminyl-peptide cyclotransferase [Acidobacteriota bacterium]
MAALLVACSGEPIGGSTVAEAAPVTEPEQRAVTTAGRPLELRARVVNSHPHDRGAYTQGLLWDGEALLESVGRYGESNLRRWAPGERRPSLERELEGHLFGEGLARVGDRLIQLTWKEELALIWDRETLRPLQRISYRGEGWGLCHDGRRLFMSDGSHTLTLRDPATFATTGELRVTTPRGQALGALNELECAEGWVFANILGSERIARIDPQTGIVTAWIDASGLLSRLERLRGAEVLNGIAYRPDRETFYLTGKYWPKVFEVVFE